MQATKCHQQACFQSQSLSTPRNRYIYPYVWSHGALLLCMTLTRSDALFMAAYKKACNPPLKHVKCNSHMKYRMGEARTHGPLQTQSPTAFGTMMCTAGYAIHNSLHRVLVPITVLANQHKVAICLMHQQLSDPCVLQEQPGTESKADRHWLRKQWPWFLCLLLLSGLCW